MAADPTRLAQRLTQLKGLRNIHEQSWREAFDYSLPEFGAGLSGAHPLNAGEIQTKKAQILDSTASDSVQTAADGYMGGITPANARWFGLDVSGSETLGVRRWLDEASDVIWENIHAANFDSEAYDAMLVFQCAGWFALYVGEQEGGGFYFENWPIAECYIASSTKAGKVDTVYREFEMSVGAVVSEYGESRVSERVRELHKAGKLDEKVRLLWAIEPRSDYMPGARNADRLPFASCHMEADTRHILRESGYHEFPVVVPRWRRIPGSVYAVGPMTSALADIKTLNEAKRWELAAAETAIAPPLKVVDDGVVNPRMIKLGPRKIIAVASVDSVQPLLTGARVDYGQIIVADLQQTVRRVMMADLFSKLLDDPKMTATQVHAIIGVLRQRMGPRFGRLQSEYLQPLVERCYGIALRAGILGRPPQEIAQASYTVRYLSPLARAQQLEDVSAMDRHEMALITEAQAVPTVMDTYDWDEAQRHRAKLLGVPLKLVPDADKVEAKRQAREQAIKQQQADEVQMGVAAKAGETAASMMAQA